MNKIIKSLFAFLAFAPFAFAFLAFAPFAFADDLTVTCYDDSRKCETVPGGGKELFYEDNFMPGNSVERTITVINERSEDCDLIMDISKAEESVVGFAEKLFTAIKDRSAGSAFFGNLTGSGQADNTKTLSDLFFQHSLPFGIIADGNTENYDWTVTFDPDTGNTYQSAEAVFDFELVFTCGEPESSPSPSPSSVPGSPTPSSPSPSSPSPSPTIIYYPYDEAIGGGFWAFAPEGEVEGEATESAETDVEGVSDKAGPDIKGETTCEWYYYLWWLPLVIQAVLLYFYYKWLNAKFAKDADAKNAKIAYWWSVPLILAGLSQIVHEILGCECVTSTLCPYYWVFNLFILISLTYYYLKKQKQADE